MGTYYVKSEDVFVISSSPSMSNLYPIDSLISRLRECKSCPENNLIN